MELRMPFVGAVWGSVDAYLAGTIRHPLLPTKTSRFFIHPFSRNEIFFKASSQVASTSQVKG